MGILIQDTGNYWLLVQCGSDPNNVDNTQKEVSWGDKFTDTRMSQSDFQKF